jgi:BASS family bile acid:Na+ symporter
MSLQKLIFLVLAASALLNLFSIGLKASLEDATYLFRRPGELVRALLAMNVLVPLFAVALIAIFDLNPAVKIALVALSVSPIPPPIPAKMVKSGGAESFVIGLHVAIGSLAIIFVPLAMELIGRVRNVELHISMAPVAKVVFISVLIPIALGIFVHQLAPAMSERVARPLTVISGIGVVVGIVGIWIAAAPAMWSLIGNGTVIALAAFVIFGLAVGHFLGGPAPENRTSLALSTASRHPGIALLLAQANFPAEKLVTAAVLLYLIVNTVVSIPYLVWTKRRSSEPPALAGGLALSVPEPSTSSRPPADAGDSTKQVPALRVR